jgi:hypothetical protein
MCQEVVEFGFMALVKSEEKRVDLTIGGRQLQIHIEKRIQDRFDARVKFWTKTGNDHTRTEELQKEKTKVTRGICHGDRSQVRNQHRRNCVKQQFGLR